MAGKFFIERIVRPESERAARFYLPALAER